MLISYIPLLQKLRRFLGKKHKASSLIEVITASVIFMVVFIISLHIVTSLSTAARYSEAIINADAKVHQCRYKYSSIQYKFGSYKELYDWGHINIIISGYADYDQLREMMLVVNMNNNTNSLQYKYIIETVDDTIGQER